MSKNENSPSNNTLAGQQCFILLQTLTTDEVEHFEFVTKKGKAWSRRRDQLWQTLKPCHGSEEAPDRASVFEAVFGEAYTLKQDYLLRNEMRHLAHALRHFLTLQEIDRQLQSGHTNGSPWLVESLHRRGEADLARKISRQALRQAEQKPDPVTRRKLHRLHIRTLAESRTLKESSYLEMLAEVDAARKVLGQETAYELAELNALQAHGESVLYVLNPASEFASDQALPELPSDAYTQYLEIASTLYRSAGEARRKLLGKALELLETFSTPRLNTPNVRGKLENNLALEHMHVRDFQQAIVHFEKALLPHNKMPKLQAQVVRLNLSTALLRAGKVEEALASIEMLMSARQRNPALDGLIPKMHVQALIQAGEFAQARKRLPDILKVGSVSDQAYLRLCLAITYLKTDAPELALREAQNLQQSLKVGSKLTHFSEAAGWLARLVVLLQTPPGKQKDRETVRLKQAVTEAHSKSDKAHSEDLPLIWIRDQVAAL